MSTVTKVSAKNHISIPKEVRERQGWRSGQMFAFVPDVDGSGVMLVPVPTWEEMRGIAKGAAPDGYRDRDDQS